MEKYELIDNKELERYEYRIGEERPHIEYKKKNDGVIFLTHTRLPESLRGKGIGKSLVKDALEDIDNQGLKLVPLCGFVASYIKKNPEWKHLLQQGIYIG